MKSGIYLVKCLSNGRLYIGSSVNIRKRWNEHRSDLRQNKHHNRHWQNAWNKYGEDQFAWSVIEETTNDDGIIREREQFWITTLQPEFNVSAFSVQTRLGAKASPETRRKQSIGRKAAWDSASEDQREEIRNSIKKSLSEIDPDIKAAWHKKTSTFLNRGNPGKRSRQARENIKASQLARTLESRQQSTDKMRATTLEARQAKAEARLAARLEWEKGREARELVRREKISLKNKGHTVSKVQREKLRVSATLQMSDPAMQEKHRQATLAAMQNPDVLKRLSESHKGLKLSAEHREKIGKALRGKKRSSETIAKMKASQLARWKKRKAQGK